MLVGGEPSVRHAGDTVAKTKGRGSEYLFEGGYLRGLLREMYEGSLLRQGVYVHSAASAAGDSGSGALLGGRGKGRVLGSGAAVRREATEQQLRDSEGSTVSLYGARGMVLGGARRARSSQPGTNAERIPTGSAVDGRGERLRRPALRTLCSPCARLRGAALRWKLLSGSWRLPRRLSARRQREHRGIWR